MSHSWGSLGAHFKAIENWYKNIVQLVSLVAHITVLNKPFIHSQMSLLWSAAVVSVFELFHVMKVGFTFMAMLSKHKEGHGFYGIIYVKEQDSFSSWKRSCTGPRSYQWPKTRWSHASVEQRHFG